MVGSDSFSGAEFLGLEQGGGSHSPERLGSSQLRYAKNKNSNVNCLPIITQVTLGPRGWILRDSGRTAITLGGHLDLHYLGLTAPHTQISKIVA